ncbi:MAG: glycosyl hydrolase family 95 catalytic domain-containing protein [Pirellulaceae bacterium]
MNTNDVTRRHWLKKAAAFGTAAAVSVALPPSVWATGAMAPSGATPAEGPAESPDWIEVDQRALVSRSDLLYRRPATRPMEGQPIGNGVMGTLVWTTPAAIHLQLNRCDVFAVNKHHRAQAQFGTTDYCSACAQVTIEVGGSVFSPGSDFEQRLSVYDASVTIAATDLKVRCFVSAEQDVLVLEIDDRRPEPAPFRLTLSHWRPDTVTTGEHTASWAFVDDAQHPVLTQRFAEGEYTCASAVAMAIPGHDLLTMDRGERSRVVLLPARVGTTRIRLSSAASQVAQADVTRRSLELLESTASLSFDDLQRGHLAWWHAFWSRTFVHLASPDGVADFMERVRNLFVYLMASTSRGALPPKWNGSLFSTDGDARTWGSQYWIWTTEVAYWPLYAADAIELTDPFFDMYLRQLPDCQRAARQRWGVGGAFYPETNPFDGPVLLPEEIAQEYRDVYLGRKQNTELSDSARQLGQYDGGLTVIENRTAMAAGRYTYISHVCSSGAELAVQAWWRFRYTGDEAWLRSRAYPLLRETAEFYRQMVQLGEDGRYHVHGTNVHEDFWGVHDSIMDLAAIRGTVPLALRAAELLGVDHDRRAGWQELLEKLAPYPLGRDPQAKSLTGAVLADDVWAAGHRGEVDGQHNPEDVWLNPVFPFEDWTLATQQPSTDLIVHKTLDLAPRHAMVLGGAGLNTAIRTPIALVRAGRGKDLSRVLASYYAAFSPLCNGLSMFEGPPNAQSLEHLALLSMTLQEALLQSVSPRPGQPEVIHVGAAWPPGWDATFRLLTRSGFLVTAAIEKDNLVGMELASRRGETCRLRNPWNKPVQVSEQSDGNRPLAVEELPGGVLVFATKPTRSY